MTLLIPIRPVLKNKDHYLIGDKKKFIKLTPTGPLVSVGGGYITFPIYLEKYTKPAQRSLLILMRQSGLGIDDVLKMLIDGKKIIAIKSSK